MNIKKKIMACGLVGSMITSLVGVNAVGAAANNLYLQNPILSKGFSTWDCIYFGNYWQEDSNNDGNVNESDKKTPLKWRVLSVDGDDLFVVSDKLIDCKPYNETESDVKWNNCTLRSWLNGYEANSNSDGINYKNDNFIDNAFSETEKAKIKTTDVNNYVLSNDLMFTDENTITMDKIYLLSYDEMGYYDYGFYDDNNVSGLLCGAYVTDYAIVKSFKDKNDSYKSQAFSYWLRTKSPNSTNNRAMYAVGKGTVGYGGVYTTGENVKPDYTCVFVRPCMHLKLSDLSTDNYAGTVSSNGKEISANTEKKLLQYDGDWTIFKYNDSEGKPAFDVRYKEKKAEIYYSILEDNLMYGVYGGSGNISNYNLTEIESKNDKDTYFIRFGTSGEDGHTIRSSKYFKLYGDSLYVIEGDYQHGTFPSNTYTIGDKPSAFKVTLTLSECIKNADNMRVYVKAEDEYASYYLMKNEVIKDMKWANCSESYIINGKEYSIKYSKVEFKFYAMPYYTYDKSDSLKKLYYTFSFENVVGLKTNTGLADLQLRVDTPTDENDVIPEPDFGEDDYYMISVGNSGKNESETKPTVVDNKNQQQTAEKTNQQQIAEKTNQKVYSTPTVEKESAVITKTSVKSIKAKKKALTITWKKAKGVTGYKIQYSLKKNFKGAKTVTVKKASVTSKTIKKLKSKKKYYVRVCTYSVLKGKTHESAWSKVKCKKTK